MKELSTLVGYAIFDHQANSKRSLTQHKRVVHLEVKYSCGQCVKQFSERGKVERHQRAVHEGVKYPCMQCAKEFSDKGDVVRHQRAVHEGVKYPACNVTKHFQQRIVLRFTKRQYMKESITLVANAPIKQV